MPSQLKGFYFKRVIGGLLGTEILFPALTKRLAEMSDDEWYDWEEFKGVLKEVAARLSPATMAAVGWRIITQAAPVFKQQGFDSPESILRDFLVLIHANVRDAPLDEVPRTVFFEPGHVVIEAGPAQPMALVKGELQAIVQIYGKVVLSLEANEIQGEKGPIYRFEMRWS